MKQWLINHGQDLHDAHNELKNMPLYYKLMAVPIKPQKDTDEYEKYLRQNAYFHRSIVPTLASLAGMGENEAKEFLQTKFACVRELKDHYEVESIGDMSNQRLAAFVDACTDFLIMEFGAVADEMITYNKTKKIKK